MSIRTPQQRELSRQLRLDKYFTSKDYELKEPLVFAMLDSWAPLVTDQFGNRNGRSLAEMLACVLERDRTFFAAIRKPRAGSTVLAQRAGWEDVIRAIAAGIVERHERRDPRPSDELMLSTDELRDRLQEAFGVLNERVLELETAGESVRGATKPDIAPDIQPEISNGIVERLLSQLEQEVVFFSEIGTDNPIPQAERNREVSKRALVRLRISELRQLAEDHGIDPAGPAEIIADRLSESVDDDAASIARMIVEDAEPTPEDGLVTIAYRLGDTPDLSDVKDRFENFVGKYARIGIARWFVCQQVAAGAADLTIRGRLRLYRVTPKLDYSRYDLAAAPREGDVQLFLRTGARWLEISTPYTSEVSDLARLADRVGALSVDRPMPLAVAVPDGDLQLWSRRTVVMLSLLAEDLRTNGIELGNLAVARFETSQDADTPGARTPTVRNVRLGGQHLLSHRQACELMTGGRALTQLTGSVRVQLSATETVIRTLRIDLDIDHLAVATTIPADDADGHSRAVHRRILDAAQRCIERVEFPSSAEAQVPAIAARSTGDNPAEADILPPAF